MVPIQNIKMTVGPIWNTGGTETEIIVPVSVLGPERAGTEMGGDRSNIRVITRPRTLLIAHRKNFSVTAL